MNGASPFDRIKACPVLDTGVNVFSFYHLILAGQSHGFPLLQILRQAQSLPRLWIRG